MLRGFEDRRDAGRRLAAELRQYTGRPDVLVLGLARGGVPVANEVARALDLPLDVFIVRKLGVPGHEELAMGAIASGEVQVLDDRLIRTLHIPQGAVANVVTQERRELERRENAYRSGRIAPDVTGRTAILVDDGLATGASMFAAISALRTANPAKIVVAVPVAAPEVCSAMRRVADECVCVLTPAQLYGVGAWYTDFSQTTDGEVRTILEAAARRRTPGGPSPSAATRESITSPPR